MAAFTKIKHDANGNPRHVTSWLGFGFANYAAALAAAKTIGGKKYHNRQFGGGIVFQAYDCELNGISAKLEELARGAK